MIRWVAIGSGRSMTCRIHGLSRHIHGDQLHLPWFNAALDTRALLSWRYDGLANAGSPFTISPSYMSDVRRDCRLSHKCDSRADAKGCRIYYKPDSRY